MWHEARRQEKKIKNIIVDYRKRADRRKEFYEKIKADPFTFLQIHGRKSTIRYDVSEYFDENYMMPWQGNNDNLIDRFDVRAHLDYINPVRRLSKDDTKEGSSSSEQEERMLNYERYRILAQNEFLGINEENFLKQLQIEEQLGSANSHQDSIGKKKISQASAAIGYNYEESNLVVPFSKTIQNIETSTTSRSEEFSKNYSDDSDMDVDISIDIVKVGTSDAHELNNCGKRYGMVSNDFFSYLTKDEDEKQSLKAIREQEADKITSGCRKSRRERRSQKERKIVGKPLSPPSYAAKEEKKDLILEDEDDEKSENSKSPSLEKITYITSFGGEEKEELKPHSKISIKLKPSVKLPGPSKSFSTSYADKVRENKDKLVSKQIRERTNRRSRSLTSGRYRTNVRRGSSRSNSNSRQHHYRSRSSNRSYRYHYRSSSYSSDSYKKDSYSTRSDSTSSSSSQSSERSRKLPYGRKHSQSRRKYSPRRCDTRSSSSSSVSYQSSSYSSHHSSSKKLLRSKSYSSEESSKKKKFSKNNIKKSLPNKISKIFEDKKMLNSSENINNTLKSETTSQRMTSIILSPEKSVNRALEEKMPVKRYYGRRRDNDSSSDLSVDSDDTDDCKNSGSNKSSINSETKIKSNNRSSDFKISKSTVGGPTITNPREKLKKKMQLLLNKTYKADKKAESEKIERQLQQQQERDEEMRELAIKLRQKQRELRHKYGDPQDSKTENDSEDNTFDRSQRCRKRVNRRSRSISSSSSSSSSNGSHGKRFLKKSSSRFRKESSGRKYDHRSRSRSRNRHR